METESRATTVLCQAPIARQLRFCLRSIPDHWRLAATSTLFRVRFDPSGARRLGPLQPRHRGQDDTGEWLEELESHFPALTTFVVGKKDCGLPVGSARSLRNCTGLSLSTCFLGSSAPFEEGPLESEEECQALRTILETNTPTLRRLRISLEELPTLVPRLSELLSLPGLLCHLRKLSLTCRSESDPLGLLSCLRQPEQLRDLSVAYCPDKIHFSRAKAASQLANFLDRASGLQSLRIQAAWLLPFALPRPHTSLCRLGIERLQTTETHDLPGLAFFPSLARLELPNFISNDARLDVLSSPSLRQVSTLVISVSCMRTDVLQPLLNIIAGWPDLRNLTLLGFTLLSRESRNRSLSQLEGLRRLTQLRSLNFWLLGFRQSTDVLPLPLDSLENLSLLFFCPTATTICPHQPGGEREEDEEGDQDQEQDVAPSYLNLAGPMPRLRSLHLIGDLSHFRLLAVNANFPALQSATIRTREGNRQSGVFAAAPFSLADVVAEEIRKNAVKINGGVADLTQKSNSPGRIQFVVSA